ncbi:MAG: preprotein translocase subunit SecY [Acidobacteriota bacterium]|nr:preprotein translocase subunit SecY [Acidobacteriota bacterium]MXZ38933.1 preprotein translocase subunit SecY [Holophagales bacterium]MDE2851786.1 preprotein translocase subunit SecY [Acidobacteriota bacterium]MDE2923719.1 preprotein translocase subunit SecY [Acidobacteriota bacterium]MDE3264681.1 preprotein translocase subunit SecY [Acidobacteriota bacterium]
MGVESFRNIFAIPDLRNRVLFMLGLLAVYRIGCIIPTPGIDPLALSEFMEQMQGTVLGFVNTFTGGSLGRVALFALGIMPYISASIILQLLTVVVPYLEKLSKEGEMGRRKITQYTRYGTVVISIIQGTTIAFFLENLTSPGGANLVLNPGLGFKFVTVLSLTTGCAFVMWLGEQISERGIGNGISLIIFAGIVVGLPGAVLGLFGQLQSGAMSLIKILLLSVFMLVVVAFIVYMERAQRRIPVQYAKRIVGRRQYGGQSTYLPLRVNTGGVIPVIFASSVVTVPATVAGMIQYEPIQQIATALQWGQPVYYLLYVAAIIFFSYFYVSIIFNPNDLAENMRKYGGFIPGIRSGRRTSEYIDRVLTRLTLVGSLYLAGVSVLPEFMIAGFKVGGIPFVGSTLDNYAPLWLTEGMGINFYFGGTSLLIVVSVAMDTLQQIESQLVMRNYEGFMKRGRIRGRRG